jgi:hypothetical protein
MIKGWSFAKIITLPIPDAALTDFPVCVKIVADTDIGGGCLASGYDIRFTAADSITLLPYERESFAVASGEATGIFWVKSDVAMAGTSVWVYYGNLSATDVSDPENAWDTNFKAVYHMNDATTSTILDSTGNDNDGAKTGANEPIEAAGKIAKGQDFVPTNDAIDCGISTSLKIQSELMVECWLSGAAPNNFAGIITRGNTDVWEFGLYGPAWGDKTFQFTIGGVDKSIAFPDFVYDAWGHAVAIFKAADDTIDWYFNGELVGQTTGVTAVIPDSENHLRIGTRDGWYSFDGLLDEVRISSVARTAAWIAYEYANMNPADGGLTWGAEKNVKSAIHMLFEG